MLRTASRRWNVGDRYEALGDTLLKMEAVREKLDTMTSKAGVNTQC